MTTLNESIGAQTTRPILILRTALLSYSETFIPSQGEKLTRFKPYYTGFIAVDGDLLPALRTITPSSSEAFGKIQETAAIFGFLPGSLVDRLREVKPQLVHAHFEEGGIKALAITQRLKIPLVVTCHGYDVTVDEYRWQRYPGFGFYYQKRRRELFSQGARFLGVSRFICDQMLKRGYPAKKIQLHYIGVDTARFAPDPSVTRRPFVLFVGRLVEKKGCEDLIRAMAHVRKKFPEMELIVAGTGPLQTQLETLARESQVKAHFIGSQSPASIRTLMAECLLLCNPSVRAGSGDSEGLGIVFLEAMAVATPVVSTRHGGIPEVVEHGVTGLLCGERQPQELASAILTLVASSELRAKFGAAGRARAVQSFDLQTQTRLLEDIYSTFSLDLAEDLPSLPR